jgi:hypothetical protein
LKSPNIDPEHVPPLLAEMALGEIESEFGKAARVLNGAAPGLLTNIPPETALAAAQFMGVQFTRGSVHREVQKEMANLSLRLQWRDATDEQLQEHLRRSGEDYSDSAVAEGREIIDELLAGDVYVAPQAASSIGLALDLGMRAGLELLNRRLVIVDCPPILITSDEPVVTVGGPGFERAERAGIANARLVLFPLTPSRLLVLCRGDIDTRRIGTQLNHFEVAEVNREILYNTTRWAFERPRRHVTHTMQVPPEPDTRAAQEGPLSPVDGTENGQLFRFCRLTRWGISMQTRLGPCRDGGTVQPEWVCPFAPLSSPTCIPSDDATDVLGAF